MKAKTRTKKRKKAKKSNSVYIILILASVDIFRRWMFRASFSSLTLQYKSQHSCIIVDSHSATGPIRPTQHSKLLDSNGLYYTLQTCDIKYIYTGMA